MIAGSTTGVRTQVRVAARYPDAFRHRKEKIARVQVQALVADVEVVELRGDPTVEVVALTHDSRRVRPGSLFACIPGEHTDGHLYAQAAIDAGAVALLVERPLGATARRSGLAEVRVTSVRDALGPLAARFFGAPSAAMSCVGVTGTNGKTTTTYVLEAVARAAGQRAGIIGTTGARLDGETFGLQHTTPEATDLQELIARMRESHAALVAIEVSSHALAQHRVDGTRFAVVCFTNLSHDHLDYHGDLASYFEAKARLFSPEFAAAAAINVDDPFGRELRDRASALGLDVVSYAIEDEAADITISDPVFDRRGARFGLVDSRVGRSEPAGLGLLGRHNVSNALAAAASARAVGLPFEAVLSGLADAGPVPGRLEPVDAGQPFLVLVDYAHTPDALDHALAAARQVTEGRRVIVVFGCGGDRDRAKRPLMGAVASRRADVAILTSDNPRSERAADIAAEVAAGATGAARLHIELDRRVAIHDAVADAGPGDVVVIAGKGHETGQTAGGVTVPFDDRAVAREAIGVRR
jgi:UDP-N-acetylmuramoyl-L-alanyl-D-glutamate--2,6-diaminopimelate ligase